MLAKQPRPAPTPPSSRGSEVYAAPQPRPGSRGVGGAVGAAAGRAAAERLGTGATVASLWRRRCAGERALEEDEEEDEEEADFQARRRRAKAAPGFLLQEAAAPGSARRPAASSSAEPWAKRGDGAATMSSTRGSQLSGRGGSPVEVPLLLGEASGLNVDPAYFDYEAAYRGLQRDRLLQAERGGSRGGSRAGTAGQLQDGAAPEEELVHLFQAHGLIGPVRAYAKALQLQGVQDVAGLLALSEQRLSVLLQRSEMEGCDELLLLEALRALR